MKKRICLLSFFTSVFCYGIEKLDHITTGAFTAGYVFKYKDAHFKDIYGAGIANVITADGSYQPVRHFAVGGKVSYWLAHGKTTLFEERTKLQEIPLTAYARGIFQTKRDVRIYASLGGGALWLKESSYLGDNHFWKGIGEVEFGFDAPVWHHLTLTGAFRYLFPRSKQEDGPKVTVGGFDLRAGLGFAF